MAYNTATIRGNEPLLDGTAKLVVEFSGNAGEELTRRTFIVGPTTTGLLAQQWVFAQLADLNSTRPIRTLPALQVGQTIAASAPPAAAGPTAKESWFRDLSRVVRMQQAIATGVLPAGFDDAAAATLAGQVTTIPIVAGDF